MINVARLNLEMFQAYDAEAVQNRVVDPDSKSLQVILAADLEMLLRRYPEVVEIITNDLNGGD